MASYDWDSVDDYSPEGEEYYCAFLDILGYKDKSDKFFSGDFNLYGRYKRAVSNSIEMLNFYSLMSGSSKIDIKFFSDSIIISYPKKNNNSLPHILNFCKVLSSNLSMDNLFVRGGLSQGVHFEKVDEEHGVSFLSSKALEKAYVLESEEAIYPRILIDPDIIIDLDINLSDSVVKSEGRYMVHYSTNLINSGGLNEDVVLSEMNDIYAIYEGQDNPRVKQKYEWLLDYYYWTLTKTLNVNMIKFEKFNFNKFDFSIFDGY